MFSHNLIISMINITPAFLINFIVVLWARAGNIKAGTLCTTFILFLTKAYIIIWMYPKVGRCSIASQTSLLCRVKARFTRDITDQSAHGRIIVHVSTVTWTCTIHTGKCSQIRGFTRGTALGGRADATLTWVVTSLYKIEESTNTYRYTIIWIARLTRARLYL